ncbi:MAG: VTT domain-containing protein [Nitrospirota bacterium]
MAVVDNKEIHGYLRDDLRPSLRNVLNTVSEKCTECELCQKECEFLRRYGIPKHIADSYDPSNKKFQALPFECSLCYLCAAVCPVNISPADMILEMRRETIDQGYGIYPEHSVVEEYEKRGTSKRYTYYAFPDGCGTVLFPGCALSGTRPDKVIKLFEYLKEYIPSLGIVLDCCLKPSHDLGREVYFHAMFDEMRDFLVKHGIQTVLVACPNCFKVFKNYGKGLTVKTVYEILADNGLPETGQVSETVSIHDPCVARFEEKTFSAIRDIAIRKGLSILEMPHHKERALCCGEGGAVGCISEELPKKWSGLRKEEARGRKILTYCAGCANALGSVVPTSHILDLIFEPEAALTGKVKVSRTPFTYLNRLKLKKRFRQTVDAKMMRERTFTAGESKKGMAMRPFLFLFFIGFALMIVRITGATNYLEQENLRNLIHGYGPLAPIIYMLIYAIAPAFFLPGLPITIVGGILFGPFWGVVYTITSSTIGASAAFLISRYLARDWVESKLRSPRWQSLDEGVKRHGWKVVAFTRLIPLFPFNLLNYAFGLTKIKFLHYVLATFVCMLPACIAFIVFSSSLLDLLKGRISPTFLAGIFLIGIISIIPISYRRYRARGSGENIL